MAKFVKTLNGSYFNVDCVEHFFIEEVSHKDEVIDYQVMLGTFMRAVNKHAIKKNLESYQEAQEWLDNFIEELEF